MKSSPITLANQSSSMRVLLLAPCLDDGGGRGISKVTITLIDALKDLGHEIIVFTGAPHNKWHSSQKKIDELMSSRAISHYLSDGVRSGAFSLSKKIFISSAVSYLLTFFHSPKTVKIVKTPSTHRSEEIKAFDSVDYFINISLLYQILKRFPRFFNSIVIFKMANKLNTDIVLSTSPTKISKPKFHKSKKIRLVQYVHDVLPLTSPETPTDSVANFAREIKNAIEGSDYILTNSRYTLSKLKDIKSSIKGSVVYVSMKKQRESSLNYPTQIFSSGSDPKSYILFMSALESRKNVVKLLEAYSLICGSIDSDLVLVGSKGYGWNKISETIDSFPDNIKKRIHIKGYVRESEKWALLKGCQLFVHPATDEGLGLPVIEALSSKTPVVATRLSSIEEFAPKDSVIYIEDPYDSLDIADKLVTAVHNIEQIKQGSLATSEEVNHFFSMVRFQQRLQRAISQIMED